MTAISELDAWLKAEIEGQDEVSVSDLRTRAYDEFSVRPGWMAQLVEEAAYTVVRSRATKMVAATRRPAPLHAAMFTGDGALQKAATHKVFHGWMEHVGDRHIRVELMNREDLLIAATERRTRGSQEIRLAEVWETIAGRLDGDELVGAKFPPAELAALLREVRSG